MSNPDYEHLRFVRRLKAEGYIQSAAVEKAFTHIRRRDFLPASIKDRAFEDRALAIQTKSVQGVVECTASCSQPSLTAMMLELLDVKPGMSVLDIGTGSGYTAALLSELGGPDAPILSVDHDPELIEKARKNLDGYGFHPEIHLCNALDTFGTDRLFERMLVTAGAPYIPEFWCRQLALNGILIVPYYWGGVDYLLKLVKTAEHELKGRGICFTVFTGLDESSRRGLNSLIIRKQQDFITLYDACACLRPEGPYPELQNKTFRRKHQYQDIVFEGYTALEGFHIYTLTSGPFSGYGLQLAELESARSGFGGYGYYALTPDGNGMILIPQYSMGREIEVWGDGDRLLEQLATAYRHWQELGKPGIGDFLLTFDFSEPDAIETKAPSARHEPAVPRRIRRNRNNIYIELDPQSTKEPHG